VSPARASRIGVGAPPPGNVDGRGCAAGEADEPGRGRAAGDVDEHAREPSAGEPNGRRRVSAAGKVDERGRGAARERSNGVDAGVPRARARGRGTDSWVCGRGRRAGERGGKVEERRQDAKAVKLGECRKFEPRDSHGAPQQLRSCGAPPEPRGSTVRHWPSFTAFASCLRSSTVASDAVAARAALRQVPTSSRPALSFNLSHSHHGRRPKGIAHPQALSVGSHSRHQGSATDALGWAPHTLPNGSTHWHHPRALHDLRGPPPGPSSGRSSPAAPARTSPTRLTPAHSRFDYMTAAAAAS
jgi:hypothetical protein